jgi:hypothetical protein
MPSIASKPWFLLKIGGYGDNGGYGEAHPQRGAVRVSLRHGYHLPGQKLRALLFVSFYGSSLAYLAPTPWYPHKNRKHGSTQVRCLLLFSSRNQGKLSPIGWQSHLVHAEALKKSTIANQQPLFNQFNHNKMFDLLNPEPSRLPNHNNHSRNS